MSATIPNFGPCWDPDGLPAEMDPTEPPPGLIDMAVEVGEQLVTDLQCAEGHSQGWSNEPLAAALVDAALGNSLASLAATGCMGRANQMAANELWRIAGPWLERGWLHTRARTKPRGYAGDYVLQARIWDETLAEDPLGRAFDRYFLSQAAAQAVRARMEQSAAALATQVLQRPLATCHAVSIGCGSAVEIELAARWLPENARRRLNVTLLDFDGEALDEAQRRLQPWLDSRHVSVRRENLHRLGRDGRTMAQVGAYDFLVCTGLFDYLPNETATELLARCWDGLVPGGRLLVGNFAPHHPTRAYMEWIGAWYLIYRTPGNLRRLAARAGIPAESCCIGAERTGCDLFLSASR